MWGCLQTQHAESQRSWNFSSAGKTLPPRAKVANVLLPTASLSLSLLASRVQQFGMVTWAQQNKHISGGSQRWKEKLGQPKPGCAAGEKGLAGPGWLLWGFPEDEVSPCPELLCPLVANKGVETEEVTPVPPASAQG